MKSYTIPLDKLHPETLTSVEIHLYDDTFMEAK
ncbi:hypothetical protein T03_8343 [Trichinella britovi]|uniref:Uncharacterized protein n=1 Tax=Trichinella britovi TaxID=45882 RepID=A0A0V1AIL4_TRIBR|nr:hypothetical protein T03_8343 [Trichinella britovi]